MVAAIRIVRHLRLHTADRSAVHRAVLLFEDAMRTASLPDDAGRIVLVRKLALGRIDSRAPPQTLALALERTTARLAAECVYAATPDAPRAVAVWFRDALDAHTRLALRLASGDATDAWYWPLAVPAWRPATSRDQALRQIALSVAALVEAPTALPQWTAALAAAGHVERLIAALRMEDVAPLAHAARLRSAHVLGHPRRAARPPAQRERAQHALALAKASAASHYADSALAFRPAVKQIDAGAQRALVRGLLRAAGTSGDGGIAAPEPVTLPDQVRRNSRARRVAVGAPPRLDAARCFAATPSAQCAAPPAASLAASAAPVHLDVRNDESTSAHVSRAKVPHGPHRARSKIEPAREPPAASHALSEGIGGMASADVPPFAAPGAGTSAGGLLFLLPVLQRLGYAEWLDAQPQWQRFDIAQRVLAALLTRLHVAPADPVWQLASAHCVGRTAPRRFVAPRAWREQLANAAASPIAGDIDDARSLWDGSGRLLFGAWHGPCPRSLLKDWRRAQRTDAPAPAGDHLGQVTDAWTVAARRWLRRTAGIGLANLVLRPARLTLTPTHADLWFELRAVELRIRRAGLDLDPGWLPWFGRVVTFHYAP